MEQQDRAIIDEFCRTQRFVTKINMLILWPKLLENKVYNFDDVNVPKWESNLADINTAIDILKTIKTRGPKAFDKLVSSLEETDHRSLADSLLKCRSNRSFSPMAASNENEPVQSNLQTPLENVPSSIDQNLEGYHDDTTKPVKINVVKAEKFCGEEGDGSTGCYHMRSKPRGYVLLITNIEYKFSKKRTGADHDEANLKKLFEDMGFQVTSRMNLTGMEMKEVVEEFSQQDFVSVDSCFVIICAHGSQSVIGGLDTQMEGIDYGTEDAKTVLCSDIIDFFSADNCTNLDGKPKIFIFQACRGSQDSSDRVSEFPARMSFAEPSRVVQDGSKSTFSNRNYSDILVAHSTYPGQVSYRSVDSGSWFIQIICEIFMKHACKKSITDLFSMVDDRLKRLGTKANGPQTSTIKLIGFNRQCYLNPGLFEDV